MKNGVAKAHGLRHSDGTKAAGRGAGRGRREGRRLLASLMAAVMTATVPVLPNAVGEAQAQRLLQISAAKRTALLTVAVGKTEDVRIDGPFTEVTVGDPEVADVTR